MHTLAYTVRATLPHQDAADAYLRWLTHGHIQAVLRAGASSASVVRLDPSPPRFEVRYLFPDRAAFDAYERDAAPALREEGRRLFGPETGIVFDRSVGTIIWSQPA